MRWLVVLVVAAGVGTIGYAVGLPYPIVYVLRGVARHVAWGLGGGVISIPAHSGG